MAQQPPGAGAFLLAACEVLGQHLSTAARPTLPLCEAQRAVARSCLFGVDKDPTAVTLARAALWIATRSDDDPETILAGAIHAGLRRYFYDNPPPGTRVAALAAIERGQALRQTVAQGEIPVAGT